MTHTPGPWHLSHIVKTAINSEMKHVAMANYYKSGDSEIDIYGEEHESNARLIASAPDLLEALKAVLDFDVHIQPSGSADPYDFAKAITRAKQAIALAEGGE